MCGICGIVHFNDKPINVEIVSKMTDVMKHRGPDDRGIYLFDKIAFGHRRLSIIGLSTGHQPMSNEDDSIWITYNGELYNYLELKDELKSKGHIFKTDCDTEVIIHLYEEYGCDCVNRMNGIFAFCIWDNRLKQIFLARDHLGVKPLYYYLDNTKFLFSSEIKAILEYDGFNILPNYKAISAYISFLYETGNETFFENILKLSAAHYAVVTLDGRMSIKKYWDLNLENRFSNKDENKIIERFRDLFEDSVKLQLMSEVPVGSFLSGGLDSSTIVYFASKHYKELQTFTIGSREREYDESYYAKMLAENLNVKNHTIYQKPVDIINTIKEMIWHLDEPLHGPATIPFYIISKKASENVKVIFSGDGGDEQWLGYPRYLVAWLNLLLKKKKLNIFEYINLIKNRFGFYSLLSYLPRMNMKTEDFYFDAINLFKEKEKWNLISPEFIHRFDINVKKRIDDMFSEKKEADDIIKKIMYLELKSYLISILHLTDKLTMAHSLEARVPFLDYRLVEFSFSIPTTLKLKNFNTKYLIRKLVEGLLPEKIINRKKMGFTVPAKLWFRNELISDIRDIILSQKAKNRAYFQYKYIEDMIMKQRYSIRDYSSKIWALLCIEIWHNLFLDK
ncbi:MAG: asparagine synthase (glutamine-hydrolyzing) [Candidatus Hydrogenedentota bacterium]